MSHIPGLRDSIETMTTIYIDECGHTGDLSGTSRGSDYDFQNQPFFALAGVGLDEKSEWEERIDKLRKRHRIQATELKSSLRGIIARPRFSADVLNLLLDEKVPLFVELVNKRFFTCVYITLFQLTPTSLGYPESTNLHFIRNIVSDFLYRYASKAVLDAFVASCLSPGETTLLTSFARLREMAERPRYNESEKKIAHVVVNMIEVAELNWRERRTTEKESWLGFIPPPDFNEHGKQVWMLPNLTSLTNIYARLNNYYEQRLADVRLVHDQQLDLESILRQGKRTCENLHGNVIPYTPHSDYWFEEQATFEFAESHEELGLQLADIVAGATMRFFRDTKAGEPVNFELRSAMTRLVDESNENTGFGLNQVVPTGEVFDPIGKLF